MNLPPRYSRLCISISALLLSACNFPPDQTSPDESAIETAVAATLAGAGEVAEAQSGRPSELTPTSTPTPTPIPQLEPTQGIMAECVVVAKALNLRYGPGTVYAPPTRYLRAGELLAAEARNSNATWIAVEVVETNETGWVSAGIEYVSCDVDIMSLPVGTIPPTPTPSPTFTPTPPRLVVGAIEGTIDGVVADEVRLEVKAYDPDVGGNNGDGIDFVRFMILYEGNVVHESVDKQPPYCAILGDDNCFYFFPDPPTWPDGTEIKEGSHTVKAIVHADDGSAETVEAGFTVEFPP